MSVPLYEIYESIKCLLRCSLRIPGVGDLVLNTQISQSHLKFTGLESLGVLPRNLHFNNFKTIYIHTSFWDQKVMIGTLSVDKISNLVQDHQTIDYTPIIHGNHPQIRMALSPMVSICWAWNAVHSQVPLDLFNLLPQTMEVFSYMPNGLKCSVHHVFYIIDVWIPSTVNIKS